MQLVEPFRFTIDDVRFSFANISLQVSFVRKFDPPRFHVLDDIRRNSMIVQTSVAVIEIYPDEIDFVPVTIRYFTVRIDGFAVW